MGLVEQRFGLDLRSLALLRICLAFLILWDLVSRASRTGLTIYYDGDCGFCQKMALLTRTFFLLPETPIRPAQEDEEIFEQLQEQNSWVLVDHEGSSHYRFDDVHHGLGPFPTS